MSKGEERKGEGEREKDKGHHMSKGKDEGDEGDEWQGVSGMRERKGRVRGRG